MEGFKTYKDRVLKATGEESTIEWEELPREIASDLLDRLTGRGEAIGEETIVAQNKGNKTIVIGGHSFTFMETMQLASVALQLLSVILTIILVCKIRK